MSRDQSSLPFRSNSFRMPVPVNTQTFLPSVTGDGDDIFCLLILKLPPVMGLFQRILPFSRFTHHSSRLSPSATFKKIRSPQMIGVEPLRLGMGSVHVTFSVLLHLVGRLCSVLMPSSVGPRHWGQFSAAPEAARIRATIITRM